MRLCKAKQLIFNYSIFKVLLTIIYIILFISFNTYSSTQEKAYFIRKIENEYLQYKSLGKYKAAIKLLTNWSLRLDDPVLLEVNLFRINELIKYQELIEQGILSFNKILNNNTIVKDNSILKSRIHFFLNELLLRKGEIDNAISIRDSLGFVKTFRSSFFYRRR